MEIVIENPSETQSVTPNSATGHVTVAAAAAAAAAVSAMSETGTITTTTTLATTEIPTAAVTSLDATTTATTTTTTTTTTTGTNATHSYHRSPRCTPMIYSNQSAVTIPEQDYYLTQRSPRPLSCSIEDFDDVSTIRRVDRSGLLEISSLDQSAATSSRYRHCRPIGAEIIAGHAGTLPRRVDRSGLLEALPELPENRRSSEELLRTSYGVQEVTMIKPDVVALVRSPTTYDSSTTSRFSNPSPSLLRPPKSPSPGTTTTTTIPTISRMSPTSNVTRRADGDSGLPNERSLRFSSSSSSSETFIPIESSIGLPTRYPYKDTNNYSSNSRNELDNEIDKKHYSTEIKERKEIDNLESLSSSKSNIVNNGDDDEKDDEDNDENLPRGERAEAEGCENTTNENLEEGRVTFNNASNNKHYHNDNVQTLTVIILSEQL